MKIECPDCGFVPFADGRAIVSLSAASYVWLCNCGLPSLHQTERPIAIALVVAGARLDDELSDEAERECWAFADLLADPEVTVEELWSAIEATR